jgi:hypothetical protein
MRVTPGGDRKRKRKTKSAAQAPTKSSPDPVGTAASSEKPVATKVPAARARPNVAGVARNVDLDWDPAAPSEKLLREQEAVRRHGFYVRPDTKDI